MVGEDLERPAHGFKGRERLHKLDQRRRVGPDSQANFSQGFFNRFPKRRRILDHHRDILPKHHHAGVHDRVRLAPIYQYIWPSGIGPRVAEPALMLINPYPWSAPLEEVRLKKQ